MSDIRFSSNKWDRSKEQIKNRLSTEMINEKKHTFEELLNDINYFVDKNKTFKKSDFDKYPSSLLLEILEYSHKCYLNKLLPEISLRLEQQLKIQSDKSEFTQLLFITRAFEKYSEHLENHIAYEERYVFPYVKQILQNNINFDQLSPHFNSLADFYINHTDTEKDIEIFIKLLKNLEPNAMLNTLIEKLECFYIDLIIHSKIEEELLIPRVISLEND